MLTPAQIKAFQQAITLVNQALPNIELLESIATAYPPLELQAQSLRSQADQIVAQSQAALAANEAMRGR